MAHFQLAVVCNLDAPRAVAARVKAISMQQGLSFADLNEDGDDALVGHAWAYVLNASHRHDAAGVPCFFLQFPQRRYLQARRKHEQL